MKNEIRPTPAGQTPSLSRRKLLQALAATGGAVITASLLPGKWTTPMVEVGYLPAHAQGTPSRLPTLEITNLDRRVVDLNGCGGPNNAVGTLFEIEFDYQSAGGDISANSRIIHSSEFSPSGRRSSFEVTDFTIDGNRFEGSITYTVCTGFGADTSVRTTIALVDDEGRTSNEISITNAKPVGANEAASGSYEIE